MLKRWSTFGAAVLLVGFTISICTPMQTAVGNQLLKATETDASDPRNWESFDPSKYADPTKLVPRPESLSFHQLKYQNRPSFPYNPTITQTFYGRGKEAGPTLLFVKAGDPVILGGKVYWSNPSAEEVKQVLLDNGDTVDIWSVSAYTPLADWSQVANLAEISPWKPDRVFARKPGWQDLVFADPGEVLTICGAQYTAPAAGEKMNIKVKDKQGHPHQMTIWSVAVGPVQPNKGFKKKKKKAATTSTTTAPAAATPSSTPAATAPATTTPAATAPAVPPPEPPKADPKPAAVEDKKPAAEEPKAPAKESAAPEKQETPVAKKKKVKETPVAEETKPVKEETPVAKETEKAPVKEASAEEKKPKEETPVAKEKPLVEAESPKAPDAVPVKHTEAPSDEKKEAAPADTK